MADSTHVELLEGGSEALRRWRAANRAIVLDLSDVGLPPDRVLDGVPLEGANLSGTLLANCHFKNANFTGADLRGANFESSDLTGAILRQADLSSANLTNARLEQADLAGAKCEGAKFDHGDLRSIKYEGATFRRASFANASLPHDLLKNTDCSGANFVAIDLSGADLSDLDLSSCDFRHGKLAAARLRRTILNSARFESCDLQGTDMNGADCELASFELASLMSACLRNANLKHTNFRRADLDGADITHADFFEADLADARMGRLRGSPSARNLLTTRIERPVYYFETAVLSPFERWFDWERVRVAGRLPFFAASYSVLIAIPLFFYALEIYNDKVVLLRTWAEMTLSRTGTTDYYIAQTVLQRLHPLPVPGLSVLLLASTLFLAVASTIYAIACPSRVKEFSRDQWTYQLGLSVVHYMADAWRRRIARLAALACYIVGGTGAAIVLGSKLLSVATFLLTTKT